MKDSVLLKLALVVGFLGLVALYFISGNVQLKPTSVSKLDSTNQVLLRGVISKIFENDQVINIELIQPDKITVVMFKKDALVDLEKGDVIEVKGRAQNSGDKEEIVADDVRVVG